MASARSTRCSSRASRDLGDLVFDRVELRREGDDRSLEIEYEQYRGIDDEDTVADEVGTARDRYGPELFNQFSLSQSDIYKIEGLQIAAETDNPLEAAVQSYVFGDVTSSEETEIPSRPPRTRTPS